MDCQIYFRQFPLADAFMHAFDYLDEAVFLDLKEPNN
jgi:hypothetical protein